MSLLKNAVSKKSGGRDSEAKQAALREVTKEKTMRLNANLPESLYKELKIKAAMNDERINDLVVKWVKKYVSK